MAGRLLMTNWKCCVASRDYTAWNWKGHRRT